MKYITVLDFEVGRVFQYKVESKDDNYERFITDKGHKLNNCEWMAHTVAGIIKNEFWNSTL